MWWVLVWVGASFGSGALIWAVIHFWEDDPFDRMYFWSAPPREKLRLMLATVSVLLPVGASIGALLTLILWAATSAG